MTIRTPPAPRKLPHTSAKRARSGVYHAAEGGCLFVPVPWMRVVHDACKDADRVKEHGLRRAVAEAAGLPWRTIRQGLTRYRGLLWFRGWLLRGENPPPGVTVATEAQVERCAAAWDYERHCRESGTDVKNGYYDWFHDGKTLGVALRLWLFGGPEPDGVFVVGEKLQRLRRERTPMAICAASRGLDPGASQGERRRAYETYRKGKRRPEVKAAIDEAVRLAASPGHPGRSVAGKGLAAETMSWVWAYAEAARLRACLKRASLTQPQYSEALRRAKRLGVEDVLGEYLANGERFNCGQMRLAGFIAPGLFVPSERMLRFREVARRAANRDGVLALMRRPGFREWFMDWTQPCPALKVPGGQEVVAPCAESRTAANGSENGKAREPMPDPRPYPVYIIQPEGRPVPVAIQEAKTPGPETGRRRGPSPSEETAAVYEFCYEQHQNTPAKLAVIMAQAQARFGQAKAPKTEGNVTEYAKRWADRNDLPYKPRPA